MDEKHIGEIEQAIESAQNGFWFPLLTIVFLFGIIITLLIFIWKRSEKANDKRHEDAEKQLAKLAEISAEQAILLQKHDIQIDHLEKQL